MARQPKMKNATLANATWEQPGAVRPFEVIGTLGLRQASGMVFEEFDEKLRGQAAIRVYGRMSRSDTTVTAILWAIESVLRGVTWEVEPALAPGESQPTEAAVEAADFVKDVLFNDMKTPWQQFIAEALSCLAFGFSLHEIIWHKREDDGRVGIYDIQPRPQDTLVRWLFDEINEVTGIVQRHPVSGGEATIPMAKMLHFRVRHWKRDPEGISLLRGAYQSWVYAVNLTNIEAIGLERDLAGLPVARVPADLMNRAAGGDATAMAQLQAYVTMVRDLRLNQQAGVVLPSDPFPSPDGSGMGGTRQYDLELLSAPSGRNAAADTAIRRHRADMATSVLADFLMLGQGSTGSWALSTDKTELFLNSLEAINASLAAEIQRGAVNALCAYNGIDDADRPKVKPGRVAPVDIEKLVSNLGIMASSGARVFPDTNLENALRQKMGLPPLDESAQGEDTLGGGMEDWGSPDAGGDGQGSPDPALPPNEEAA